MPLNFLYNFPFFFIIFPGAWSVPANKDPIIIASAPAENALAKSPENLIPPSEMKLIFLVLIFFFISNIALN